MTTLREAAQQALEALEKLVVGTEYEEAVEAERAIDALKAALEEPVQEPVAVVRWNDIGHISWRTHVMLPDDTPLYAAPPQRKPLVDPAEYDDAGAAERYNRGLK